MKFPYSTIALCCLQALGFGLATSAQAETVIYTGDANDLQTQPTWMSGGSNYKMLAPSLTSLSGNTVVVDFVNVVGNVPYNIVGGLSETSDVTNNEILLQQGRVQQTVYGGYTAATGNALNNTVSVTGGNWTDVRGGYSNRGTASGNKVNVDGGTIGNIYAGYVFNGGSVLNNTANITAGTISGSVFAGLNAYGNTNVAGNTVNMSGGSVGSSVYGGRSYTGSASENTISFSGGHITGNIYAGFSSSANNKMVSENQIIISGNGTSGGNAYGGYSAGIMYAAGEASVHVRDNSVSVLNSSFSGDIYSGYATLTHNYGGNLAIDVANNQVKLVNSTTQGTIYGGYGTGISGLGDIAVSVTGNKVAITDGTINGNVYGGYGTAVNTGSGNVEVAVTNNTITIDGSPIFGANASLYGGGSDIAGADVFTGNNLNINTLNVSVKDTDNFQSYNFNIPTSAVDGSVMLNATGSVNLNNATVALKSIAPGIAVASGSQVVLINAGTLQTNSGTSLSNNTPVYQGISLLYDVDVKQDGSNRIVATFNEAQVNDAGTKPLAEGRLAGLAYTLQGADLAAEQGIKAALASASLGDAALTVFGTVSGSSSRYDSGSHIDVDGVSMMAGLAWKQDDLVLAGFLEGGKGNYDSYNSFDNAASVHGNGDTSYYGIGILGRYTLDNGIYLDGTARVGQVDTDFNSRDIISAEGVNASYDSKSTYYGASIGAGYAWKLSEKSILDVSTQYLWTHQGSDSVNVAGDPIDFAAANSHRVRTLGRLYQDVTSQVTLMAGLGYEYEFDGEVKGTTYHSYEIDAPSIKGGTGIGELGVSFMPTNNPNFTLDAKLRGYAGKREGFAGFAQAKYAF